MTEEREKFIANRKCWAFLINPETGIKLAVDDTMYAHPGRNPLPEFKRLDVDTLEVEAEAYITFFYYNQETRFHTERIEDLPKALELFGEFTSPQLVVDPDLFASLLKTKEASQ